MATEKKAQLEEGAVLLLNKGRRGLLRLVFGRTAVIIVLLLAQVALLLAGFAWLGEKYVYGGSLAAALIAALVVINRPGSPEAKITWILLITLLPVFGAPFYAYVELELGHRLARARLAEVGGRTAKLTPGDPAALEALRAVDPGAAGLCAYVAQAGNQPVYQRSGVSYCPSGEKAFAAILAELERAERFIFLEYFIIQEGYMWGRILSVLERKARAGVEVRVLYDGTCVVGKLPYQYPQKLEELGIRCRMYAPLRPLVSTHYNN
ncbi:MAG: PLDc N-terminal domain-containing protein, partial [Oscillospiraceae bacterium]|nr:PLDc N-terminal domain-containing protein [Oscillospiraceae bacterium]